MTIPMNSDMAFYPTRLTPCAPCGILRLEETAYGILAYVPVAEYISDAIAKAIDIVARLVEAGRDAQLFTMGDEVCVYLHLGDASDQVFEYAMLEMRYLSI